MLEGLFGGGREKSKSAQTEKNAVPTASEKDAPKIDPLTEQVDIFELAKKGQVKVTMPSQKGLKPAEEAFVPKKPVSEEARLAALAAQEDEASIKSKAQGEARRAKMLADSAERVRKELEEKAAHEKRKEELKKKQDAQGANPKNLQAPVGKNTPTPGVLNNKSVEKATVTKNAAVEKVNGNTNETLASTGEGIVPAETSSETIVNPELSPDIAAAKYAVETNTNPFNITPQDREDYAEIVKLSSAEHSEIPAEEVPYEINPPIEHRSYIKGLKQRDLKDRGPWPSLMLSALTEIGAQNIEITNPKENTVSFTMHDASGKAVEFVMSKTEAAKFLQNTLVPFDESDFQRSKKKEVAPVPEPAESVVLATTPEIVASTPEVTAAGQEKREMSVSKMIDSLKKKGAIADTKTFVRNKKTREVVGFTFTDAEGVVHEKASLADVTEFLASTPDVNKQNKERTETAKSKRERKSTKEGKNSKSKIVSPLELPKDEQGALTKEMNTLAYEEASAATVADDALETNASTVSGEVLEDSEVVLGENRGEVEHADVIKAEIGGAWAKNKENQVVEVLKNEESVPADTPQTLGEAMQEIAEGVEPTSQVLEGEFIPAEKAKKNGPTAKEGNTYDHEAGKQEIPKGERKESSVKETVKEFDQRFASEFGISREDLEGIEGFEKLSLTQQKMVFENLVQSTYGRIEEETAAQYATEAEAKRGAAVAAYGRFAGKAWAGIRAALSKDFNMLKTEQSVAENFKKGGIATHRSIIEQLTKSMSRFGPRIHEDEKTGELLVDLVNIEFDRGNRKDEFEAVRSLNHAAHQFSKIPAAWREKTLGVDASQANEWGVTKLLKEKFSDTRKQQIAYSESLKAFTEAKGALEITLRKSGKSDQEIAEILLGVDDRVQQLQFIQTSPDAVAALADIKDKNVYLETAKRLVGKSGLGYVALGYVGRTFASTALGWFAAPVVSSGIAASRSWTKTAAELRERDRNARMGVKDTSAEALNVVSAESLMSKTRILIDRYQSLGEQINEFSLEGKDVSALRVAQDTTLDRLKERVTFIRDKQNLGRVQYGTRDTFIGTQVALYETLGEAAAIVAEGAAPDNESLAAQITFLTEEGKEDAVVEERLGRRQKLASRLDRFLEYKEDTITARRKSYRRQELTTQALKAGGMSLGGAFLAEYYRDAVSGKIAGFPFGNATAAESGVAIPPETPPLETITDLPETASYTIKRGDTLTKIFKEFVPSIEGIESQGAQNTAIANMINSFSESELRQIGLRNGNVHMIYAGDTIKLDELSKIIAEKQSNLNLPDLSVGDTEAGPVAEAPKPTQPVVAEAARVTPPVEAAPVTARPVESAPIIPETYTPSYAAPEVSSESVSTGASVEKVPDAWYAESAVADREKRIQELFTYTRSGKSYLEGIVFMMPARNLDEIARGAAQSDSKLRDALRHMVMVRNELNKMDVRLIPAQDESIGKYVQRVSNTLARQTTSEQYEKVLKILSKGIRPGMG